MKNTLFLYLSKQIFLATVIIAFVLASALWLAQSVKLVQFVINGGAPLSMFFSLMTLSFPQLLTPILPLCFCFAILFVYLRLYQDSELIVLRGSGLSAFQLLKPMLAIAVAFMLIHWLLTISIAPFSKRELRDQRQVITSEYSAAALREGMFNSMNANLTIYVKARSGGNHYNGILIHDTRNKEVTVTITAAEGALLRNKGQPVLVIQRGTRQEKNMTTGQISWLEFDEYAVDLKSMASDSTEDKVKAGEQTFSGLFDHNNPDYAKYAKEFRLEANERLSSPLWNMAYGTIAMAVLLCGTYRRRGVTQRILLAGLGAIIVQGCLFGLNSAIDTKASLTWVLYILPLLICGIGFGFIRANDQGAI